ncbi:hypothetical protein KAFR_0A08610 [Kazachstania africana CBS 2517]|uniref:J domain-containing protein n=1 Tax=Kazachstania africana (strain ATCC 22294 / BCRC 22015 / CBS 2517 / CECT 1963 / NBRC 1671 / NRRL Y-8276) TaxID=1071382 RepID=H2APJ5_KAZAF|nr:hypothetical protein KAFR_0A08610 [Kazachstania africana CBS 2517]CCF56295.1 hypothetical protein KAFR_0A08610 [Kazachstania africana CBS 2517]
MVLPLVIGVGVTVVAISVRAGAQAWSVYKTLTPIAIARLNNIKIRDDSYFHKDLRFLSSRIDLKSKTALEQYEGGFHEKMNESEALLILNISPHEIKMLNESLLKRKHRQALVNNHPDKGGSPYVAAKVNEARDLIRKSVLIRRE